MASLEGINTQKQTVNVPTICLDAHESTTNGSNVNGKYDLDFLAPEENVFCLRVRNCLYVYSLCRRILTFSPGYFVSVHPKSSS